MYKLRADVQIADAGLHVKRGTGPRRKTPCPTRAIPIWVGGYTGTREAMTAATGDAIRVAHCIPETGIELTGDSYILESGFERLHGVDFRKGCYVGQEVTARMKHKTELRKGLVRVNGERQRARRHRDQCRWQACRHALYPVGAGFGIAYLRLDRAGGTMRAGDAGSHWPKGRDAQVPRGASP